MEELVKRPRGQQVFPPCGTYRAYRAHLRYGQPVDEACQQVALEHHRQARAERVGVCVECGQEKRIEARYRCASCYSRRKRAEAKKRANKK